jgi:hypothetical protein
MVKPAGALELAVEVGDIRDQRPRQRGAAGRRIEGPSLHCKPPGVWRPDYTTGRGAQVDPPRTHGTLHT